LDNLDALLSSSGFNDIGFEHPHELRQAKWLRDAFVGTPIQSVLPTSALHYILLWAHVGELMNLNGFPMTIQDNAQGDNAPTWSFTKRGINPQAA
jgi:hypothetical protein